MANLLKVGWNVVFWLGFCLLLSGIRGHIRAGTDDVIAPNNYFIGLGSLFAGMGIVLFIIDRRERIPEEKPQYVTMT